MSKAQSIIGGNAAIRYLKAYQAHVDYWREVKPAYQLGMVDKPEHVPYLLQYAADLEDSMIVARIYHPLDGGFHLAPTGPGDTRRYVSSPAEYLGDYGDLGVMDNIILHVMNEPNANGSPDEMMRLVSWMIDYIPLAAAKKCKSVLFNWGDKNPRIINGMMDEQFNNVLMLMAAHPELFFMGMHFYGPDEITSTLDSYVARCEDLKIKPPTVIGTEFGIDSTGGTQRGYKTWPNYKDIYGGWLVTQVKSPTGSAPTLYKHIQSGVLGGLCIFQEGNSGGQDDFDFENDTGVKTTIKTSALNGELMPPTLKPSIPPPPPITVPPLPAPLPPFTSGARYVITTPLDNVNLRADANITTTIIGQVPNQSVVTVFEEKLVQDDYWRKIQFGSLTGWVSMQKGVVKFAPYLPTPSTVTIPLDLLKDIQASLKNEADELRRLSLALASLSDDFLKDYELVKAILDKVGGTT